MRSHFDEQLMKLNGELIEMGALCEEIIATVFGSFSKRDKELVKKASLLEQEIDRKERTVENMCLKLLLQQQPVAKDLRKISAALKMITDMERIGDQADDIAEIVVLLDRSVIENDALLKEMALSAVNMVTKSVDAFVKNDVELAKSVISDDDIVDGCFDKIKKLLIEKIAASPQSGEAVIDLLIIAKYFERIGDHAVNIAEWVIFSVTGVHKE